MPPTPKELERLERMCRIEDEANCPVIAGRMLTNEPEPETPSSYCSDPEIAKKHLPNYHPE
jgi:hypothetical protein